jgi:hypothetical protein
LRAFPRKIRLRLSPLVRRRLIVGLLLGFAIAAGLGALVLTAARSVQNDLAAAQRLMSQAADRDPSLADRTVKLSQAGAKINAAQQELQSFPLRTLASVPLLGRDVRVARAVAGQAGAIVAAGQELLTVLVEAQRNGRAPAPVIAVASALTKLTETVRASAEPVKASRPLFVTGPARERFLAAAAAADRDLLRLSQAADFLSSFYQTKGSKAYFVGFQNPAELRGTGGLIGVFGILTASASGPTLREAGPIEALQGRFERPASIAPSLRARYRPFRFDGDWRQANLPPDLPTVGRVLVEMYEQARRTRLQGVIMLDPMASAEILRVAGPVTVDGQRLDATNLPRALMIDAEVRYEGDPAARKKFLTDAAGKVLQVMKVAAGRRPLDMLGALRTAVLERHLQAYSSDPDAQRILIELGMAGNGDAPPQGDYLMPVGINLGGNKLDAFLRKKVRYDVRLRADGGADTTVTVSLHNAARTTGLPKSIIGPIDSRFRPGENRHFLELYLSRGYGMSEALMDGRRIGMHALDSLGGLMLGTELSIPAKRSVTLEYRLKRWNAVQLEGNRLKYRVLVRPQPQVRPEQLTISITPPPGWKLVGPPAGFVVSQATASWTGVLDRERVLGLEMESAGPAR